MISAARGRDPASSIEQTTGGDISSSISPSGCSARNPLPPPGVNLAQGKTLLHSTLLGLGLTQASPFSSSSSIPPPGKTEASQSWASRFRRAARRALVRAR